MVESQPSKLLVAGSNPVSRSIVFNTLALFSLYDGTTPITSRHILAGVTSTGQNHLKSQNCGHGKPVAAIADRGDSH